MARRKRTVVTTQTTKPYYNRRYFVYDSALEAKEKEVFPLFTPNDTIGVFLDKEPLTCELPKSMFLNTVEYGDSFKVCDILMYVQSVGYDTVIMANYHRSDILTLWLADLLIEDGIAVQDELPFE